MNDHTCNAYCTETEHCELVYTSERGTEGKIRQAMGYYRGLKVTRAEPAPEAPPMEMIPAAQLDHLQGPPSDAMRWLVWWDR